MDQARVLIVEDEPIIGELLLEILRLEGYDGKHSETGAEGITTARAWKPDIVILDLMLPDIDGFEVCATLRKTPDLPQPGILMLTGMVISASRQNGFAAGADRFLTKPFQVPDIIAEVAALLDEYRVPRADGLRRECTLPLAEPKQWQDHVQRLMVDLARTTPLTGQEIDAIAREINELENRIESWHRQHGAGPQPWHLVLKVFRDRLVSVLSCDEVAPPASPTDSLHSLFGLASKNDPLPLPTSLADEVVFPDHGSIVVLTRRFDRAS